MGASAGADADRGYERWVLAYGGYAVTFCSAVFMEVSTSVLGSTYSSSKKEEAKKKGPSSLTSSSPRLAD